MPPGTARAVRRCGQDARTGADAGRVDAARAALRALGVYGPVSVLHWSGKKLPYVDNLATLVVCEDPGEVPAGELMRVLRPFGALVVKQDGKWTATVKPQLPGTDQWNSRCTDCSGLGW